MSSPAVRPASAQAVRPSRSTSILFMAERSSTIPPSVVPWPAPLCPPLRTASSRPVSRANPMTRATSAALAARTMTAGWRSIPPVTTARAVSYSGSPGTMTVPSTAARSDGSERGVRAGQRRHGSSLRESGGLLRPVPRRTGPPEGRIVGRMARARHPARSPLPGSGIRASKRAPPSGRLAAAIRPPWCSTIQAAMARPRPVPPLGASSARQKRSKTCGRSSGRIPGPAVLDGQHRRVAVRPHAHGHGATRGRVGDGVVDEDRHQLPEAQRIAHDGGGQGVDDHRSRRDPRPSPSASLKPPPRRRRDRPARAPAPSCRRRSGRAAAGRRRVPRGGSSRRRCRRWPSPPMPTGSVGVAAQVGHAGPDHREGRPQLVARVGGELALAAQGSVATVDGRADRDECPPGVDPAGDDGEREGGQAADDEDRQERREQALLGDPLADHLDDVLAIDALHGRRVDPDRRLADHRFADVRAALAGRLYGGARWGAQRSRRGGRGPSRRARSRG